MTLTELFIRGIPLLLLCWEKMFLHPSLLLIWTEYKGKGFCELWFINEG